MRRLLQLMAASFVLAALASCAFSAVRRPALTSYQASLVRTKSLPVAPGRALSASQQALAAMGYEIQSVVEELGTVRTKVRPALVPQLCDCGTWNGGIVSGTADSVLVITVQLQTAIESVVTIEHQCITTFTGQNLYGATTRREVYQCASKGLIEKEFWTTLGRVIESARPSS